MAAPAAATLQSAVRRLTDAFRSADIETPALDARRLVLGMLGLDDAALLREPERPLDAGELTRLDAACTRRLAHEPVSRIVGRRAFHGLDLEIGPATLDPRPDTESLVDGALRLVAEGLVPGGNAPHILDLGTGSGAIIIALLRALPAATGVATDMSESALEIASRNAARHGLSDRVSFRKADWFDGVEGTFDLVVSNPPYIPTPELSGLEPEVANFDPQAALDGGADGLDAYRIIASGLRQALRPRGWVAVEIGQGQSLAVATLLQEAVQPGSPHGTGTSGFWHDLAGIARCVAVEARA